MKQFPAWKKASTASMGNAAVVVAQAGPKAERRNNGNRGDGKPGARFDSIPLLAVRTRSYSPKQLTTNPS